MTDPTTDEIVIDTVVEVLGIPEQRMDFDADTELFGALPELDSLAILELITSLEEKFAIEIDADNVTGENFADVRSLAALVERLRS